MTTVTAPPDLAALIDRHRAAMDGADTRARVDSIYDLIRWKGWEKRVRYVHGGTAVSLVWGSLQIVRWPMEGPRPKHVLDHLDRSMTRDQAS